MDTANSPSSQPEKSPIVWLRRKNGEYYAVDDDFASWRLYCRVENGCVVWALYRNRQRLYATGTRAHAKKVADLWVANPDGDLPDPVPSRRVSRWGFVWFRSQKRPYSYLAITGETTSWRIVRQGYGHNRQWVAFKDNVRFGETDTLSAAKELCEQSEATQ